MTTQDLHDLIEFFMIIGFSVLLGVYTSSVILGFIVFFGIMLLFRLVR